VLTGKRRFHEDQVSECIEALETMPCEVLVGDGSWTFFADPWMPRRGRPCSGVIRGGVEVDGDCSGHWAHCEDGTMCEGFFVVGCDSKCVETVGAGEACDNSVHCDDEHYCSSSDDGACLSLPSEGEGCPDDICGRGLRCVYSSRTCRERYRPNDPCNRTLGCGDWLRCVPTEDGNRCLAPRKVGEPCSKDLDDCARGVSYCVDGICQLPPPAGEPCLLIGRDGEEPGHGLCSNWSLYCSEREGPGICLPRKQLGELCERGQCERGTCLDGVCNNQGRALGDECESYLECRSHLCLDGTCQSLKSAGATCDSPLECRSQRCSAGICEAPFCTGD